jgi:hypothetical protein
VGSQIVVTGVVEVVWDADDLRQEWDMPDATDEDLLAECTQSVANEWPMYASGPDNLDVSGEIRCA